MQLSVKPRIGEVRCCGHELFACCESVITDLYMWDLGRRMKVLLIYGVYMYVQSKVNSFLSILYMCQ